MAKARAAAPKSSTRPLNRRGSPEAIEKRRVARMFNDVLGNGPSAAKLDGRTEKRRQRLLKELEEGKHGDKDLKPLDVLTHVQELLALGEPLANVKKARKLPKAKAASDETVQLIKRLHEAYQFRPECYAFVGIGDDVLAKAGVLPRAEKKTSSRRARGA